MRLIRGLSVLAIVLGAVLLALGHDEPLELQSEWLHVLRLKANYQRADKQGAKDSEVRRQEWTNAVVAFARAYPQHSRARQVHEDLVLDRARVLAKEGRSDEAIGFYRALSARNRENQFVQRELKELLARKNVECARLAGLLRGMSRQQVLDVLGEPPGGWKSSKGQGALKVESLYYPTLKGPVAGVFFVNDELFAAECGERIELKNP